MKTEQCKPQISQFNFQPISISCIIKSVVVAGKHKHGWWRCCKNHAAEIMHYVQWKSYKVIHVKWFKIHKKRWSVKWYGNEPCARIIYNMNIWELWSRKEQVYLPFILPFRFYFCILCQSQQLFSTHLPAARGKSAEANKLIFFVFIVHNIKLSEWFLQMHRACLHQSARVTRSCRHKNQI